MNKFFIVLFMLVLFATSQLNSKFVIILEENMQNIMRCISYEYIVLRLVYKVK